MKYLLLLSLAVFCSVTGYGQMNTQPPRPQMPPPPPDGSWFYMDIDSLYRTVTGQHYVPFDVTTLDGKHLTNETCKGKVTFINFWFGGCAPCRGEFGELNRLYDSLKGKKGYEFVAISFDPKPMMAEVVKNSNIRYPVATVEDSRLSKKLDYNMGYPNSIILDKKGNVAYIGMKAITDTEDKYKVPFDKILAIMKKEVRK